MEKRPDLAFCGGAPVEKVQRFTCAKCARGYPVEIKEAGCQPSDNTVEGEISAAPVAIVTWPDLA